MPGTISLNEAMNNTDRGRPTWSLRASRKEIKQTATQFLLIGCVFGSYLAVVGPAGKDTEDAEGATKDVTLSRALRDT